MKFVGLISGGKDSIYNIVKCVSFGHELIALANLEPPDASLEEIDSFTFQSAAHVAVAALADCLGVPLIRRAMNGRALNQNLFYDPTPDDEVEDMFKLLQDVKVSIVFTCA